MRCISFLCLCANTLFAVSSVTADQVSFHQTGEVATLENRAVRVEFDLAAGRYRAIDRRDRACGFRDGCVALDDWTSTRKGGVCRASDRPVWDSLGRGRTLAVECSHPGQPTLLLEITLYDGYGFLALRSGIVNTTKQPLRVKQFYPLTAASAFPEAGEIAHAKSLDGEGGGRDTAVRPGPARSSSNNVLMTFRNGDRRRTVVLGGLSYHEWMKWAAVWPSASAPSDNAVRLRETEKKVYLHLEAMDPVGRRVDPGERYLPEDRFYVDFVTDDPFRAAEQYGLAVRAAQRAAPNPYTFPTICSWYAGVTFEPNAQNHPEKSRYGIATTSGQVAEMDFIRKTSFLDYSTIALRLVPDNYTPNNPQGWWDDKHWQQQGFYTLPYETSAKWGQALQKRGGLAFTYFQSDRVSADFRKQHRNLVLPGRGVLDYTKPEVQRYMRGVYAAMRGNIAGMMFDYCDELWSLNLAKGGFFDDRAAAASVYRLVFQLAKQGLGPRSWIHERPIDNPGSDMAVGLIDSQRTSGDTASISPKLVARSGLRWYKNRVLFAYDMDSKSLTNAWKETAPGVSDVDGRRMTLTMCYVAASRLLLANSFRDLPAEAIHDLERTLPYHTQPRSARPLDAFVVDGPPRVYDYPVNGDWHQLTLLNTDGRREAAFVLPLHGEPADGAMGLDRNSQYYVYDFWNDAFCGKLSGGESLRQTLRPGEARMLSVHRAEPHPQFLSTNRHLMQGLVDLVGGPRWDARGRTLAGMSKVIAGETYQVVLAGNGYRPLAPRATGAAATIEPLAGAAGLYRLSLRSPRTAEVYWTVSFLSP